VITGLLIVSALTLQSWFDYEVQKQLDATEADINEIIVTEYNITLLSVNITVNTSFSNPHNLKVTVLEANLSVLYNNAELGVLSLPEMILSKKSSFLLINTTFYAFAEKWLSFSFFIVDLAWDNEVFVNISGQLVLKAPALFITVRSTNQIEKEIALTLDLFTLSKLDY
jgi:hypothetical protein